MRLESLEDAVACADGSAGAQFFKPESRAGCSPLRKNDTPEQTRQLLGTSKAARRPRHSKFKSARKSSNEVPQCLNT